MRVGRRQNCAILCGHGAANPPTDDIRRQHFLLGITVKAFPRIAAIVSAPTITHFAPSRGIGLLRKVRTFAAGLRAALSVAKHTQLHNFIGDRRGEWLLQAVPIIGLTTNR